MENVHHQIFESNSPPPPTKIHSTKIYHVYNQSPEMLAQGQQLVSELEELASGQSRRSTLRRHYTPGDYLRYGDEGVVGAGGEYHSLGRRRTMSASALGRGGNEQTKQMCASGERFDL